ncbi:MAG: MIP family channel protein [Dehalococcoidia bacterium]|nr:MIP family channel protein [Dehalococcoidia bacterium]
MTDFLSLGDLKDRRAWQATLAEFMGLFLFVFIGPGAVVGTSMLVGGGELTVARLTAIALAHGLAIAVLVAAIARVSGGHINPAVTITAVVTRKMGMVKGCMYVVAQLLGAALGALLLAAVVPNAAEGALGGNALSIDVGPGLVVEIVLTFALVFVIFATAVDPKGPAHLAPFAIGITVLIAHFIGVPLTGASMNPARSFGPALATGMWADHWVYWVGPIIGGLIAGVLYDMVYIKGRKDEAA